MRRIDESGISLAAAFVLAAPPAVGQQVRFGEAVVAPTLSETVAHAVADFNADGFLDVAVATTGLTIETHLNDGAGSLGDPVVTQTGMGQFERIISLAASDIDGDGDVDMAGGEVFNGSLVLMFNDGTGAFSVVVDAQLPVNPFASDIRLEDIDGDGDADIVTNNGLFSGDGVVLFNDGTGAFGQPAPFPIVGALQPRLDVGDIDGDGDPDVVTVERNGDQLGDIQIAFNDGGGASFTAGPRFGPASDQVAPAIFDADGDGDMDLAVSDATARIRVFLNQGGAFVEGASFGVFSLPDEVLARDLNADGVPDLVVTTEPISVLTGRGDGTFGPNAMFGVGGVFTPQGGAVRPVIADIDGDTRPDLVTLTRQGVAVLPNRTPCLADVDDSGGVDFSDVILFLGAFGAACP